MKKILSLLALLSVVLMTAPSYSELGECYTTRAELYDYIFELQQAAEDSGWNHVRVDSIGHSRGDQLGIQYPIYAVKFSDNVDVFEDEPTTLLIAHIHAEEVAGIEGMVKFMWYLTHHRPRQPYRDIINQTQVYVIPTMNPDGLEVLSLGWDDTWRKNGYKPPQLAECNVHVGLGGDSCGVDLNRNFELNWIWGDTLWYDNGSFEAYDYFRGPGPMSEPETQAVANFAMQIKPTTSIVWHSSRSGRFGSQTFGAWEWGGNNELTKHAPDSIAIKTVQGDAGFGYTGTTERWGESTTSPYSSVWAGTQNGALQDWFYWKLGCIQITTETSPEAPSPPANIQPACEGPLTIDQLAETLLMPNEWMCRRLRNIVRFDRPDDMDGQGAPLAIYTKVAGTDQAISAEWRILDTWSPLLHPWYTNEEFGRATFLPPPGQTTVMARKEGYLPDTATVTINPGGGQRAYVTLNLEPLPWYNLSLRVENEDGEAIAAKVHLISDFPMWMDLSTGEGSISKPQVNYEIAVVPEDEDNYIAIWSHFWLGQDTSFTFVLPDGDTVFSEDFSNGLTNWTSGGDEDLWGTVTDTTAMGFGQGLHTNPDPGTWRPVYGQNADTWIEYNNTIDLTSSEINSAHLGFDRRGRLEVPLDSLFLEVSTDGETWEVAKGYCDMQLPWTRDWVNLTRWVGNEIHLRFHFVTDESLQELGLNIDNIKVMAGLDLDEDTPPAVVPYTYKINKAYPNPFNPSTTIDYEVAAPGLVSFGIYNLLGQQVWRTDKMLPAAGPYRFRWNGVSTSGAALASGIYFIRMHTDVIHSTKKLMLLK